MARMSDRSYLRGPHPVSAARSSAARRRGRYSDPAEFWPQRRFAFELRRADTQLGLGLGQRLVGLAKRSPKNDRTKKGPPIAAARHICTVSGQVPGGLFTIDHDRLMSSAFKMAHTRSAT